MTTDPGAAMTRMLEPAFRHAFNAIILTDADFTGGGPHIIAANPAFCTMTGYDEAELIGKSPRIMQGPATDPAVIERLRSSITAGHFFIGSTVNYRKDGTAYIVEWNITPVREDDRVIGFVSVQQDITARLAAEREHTLFTTMGDLIPTPLVILDADERITFANRAFEVVSGYRAGELTHRDAGALFAPDLGTPDPARPIGLGESREERLLLIRRDGTPLHVDRRSIPLGVERVEHVVCTIADVTELVRSEQRWRDMAHADPLTGLLNRRGADEALVAMLKRSPEQAQTVALMVCDIDHFKRVNDEHGHALGDTVLVRVAGALQRLLRTEDVVARHGGEEFLIAVSRVDAQEAVHLAERLRREVATESAAAAAGVTMSVGVAVSRTGESADALIARADAALYRAKREGRDRVVLDASL